VCGEDEEHMLKTIDFIKQRKLIYLVKLESFVKDYWET